ncbi:MAG: hypothetical protein RR651_00200 [Lysinibacillus sp.]
MNNRTLNTYVHELHWHLPEETQQEAIDYLIENAPLNDLGQLFVLSSKPHWQNCMKVVDAIGYPYNIAAFPKMVELFQDMNWPGAREIVDYFKTLDKQIVVPFIEAGGKQAMKDNDDQWLWFLYTVCKQLHIERAHFYDDTLFDIMEEIYARDA